VHRVCALALIGAEMMRAGGDESAAARRLSRQFKRMPEDLDISGHMGGAR